MACCAAFALLLGSLMGMYRALFRRNAASSFPPMATRVAPGNAFLPPSTALGRDTIQQVSRIRPFTVTLFCVIAFPALILAAIYYQPSSASRSLRSADELLAAPIGSNDWCNVICSPLCLKPN